MTREEWIQKELAKRTFWQKVKALFCNHFGYWEEFRLSENSGLSSCRCSNCGAVGAPWKNGFYPDQIDVDKLLGKPGKSEGVH